MGEKMESTVKKIDFGKPPEYKDGDGDDTGINELESITLQKADNGFIVTSYYINGDTILEVFDEDGKDDGVIQTMESILDSLGLKNAYSIRKKDSLKSL